MADKKPAPVRLNFLRRGDLNPQVSPPNGIDLPQTHAETASTPQLISYILGKQLEKDAKQGIDRWPAKAIVLGVQITYCTNNERPNIAGQLGVPKQRLYVKAHIPEIHGSIPLPKRFDAVKNMSIADRMRMGMHPTFIGEVGKNDPTPEIGDIVLVDYDNRGKLIGGIYIGIAEHGYGGILDEQSPTFSGKGYFDRSRDRKNKPSELRSKRERFLNADFYQHPMTLADY
mgnify:CR=1 FL=1